MGGGVSYVTRYVTRKAASTDTKKKMSRYICKRAPYKLIQCSFIKAYIGLCVSEYEPYIICKRVLYV